MPNGGFPRFSRRLASVPRIARSSVGAPTFDTNWCQKPDGAIHGGSRRQVWHQLVSFPKIALSPIGNIPGEEFEGWSVLRPFINPGAKAWPKGSEFCGDQLE